MTFEKFLSKNPYQLTKSFNENEWQDSMYDKWSVAEIKHNKRLLYDYNRFKDMTGSYNRGEIIGDIFTLYRIKDNSVITSFNIKTFLPL